MLKGISVFLATILLHVAFTLSTANATPMVNLTLDDPDIAIGDSFDVQVWVTDSLTGVDLFGSPEALLDFGFDVSTTGSVVSYTGSTVAPLFDDVSDVSDNNNVAGMAFPGVDVSSNQNVLLATLTFDALSVGNGSINVFGDYSDMSNFFGLWYEDTGYDINDTLQLSITNPVPEPSSVLLFCVGIAGMGVFSRYRKK